MGEGRAATMGQSLFAKACEMAGVNPEVAPLWFKGIELTLTEEPPVAVLPNYPSVMEDRQRAAVELERLAGLGGIHWREEGSHPPDLRARPSHLIAKGGRARAVHDWSRARCPVNSVLSNPPPQ